MTDEWPQDYVWPKLLGMKAEVGKRIWINTEESFFEAVITEVGEPDEDGSYTMTCQRYPL